MNVFRYGLQARPLFADPQLLQIDRVELIEPHNVNSKIKDKMPRGVRHGILVTSFELDKEFVKSHELVDINFELNSKWVKTISTIDYLIKKDITHKYTTPSFYKQIQMSEDEFFVLLKEHGYDNEYELLEQRGYA